MATKKASAKKSTLIKIAETIGTVAGEISVKKDQLVNLASDAFESVKSGMKNLASKEQEVKKSVKADVKKAGKKVAAVKKTIKKEVKQVVKPAAKKIAAAKKSVKKSAPVKKVVSAEKKVVKVVKKAVKKTGSKK